jgi:alkanesulfonate monooxygenase
MKHQLAMAASDSSWHRQLSELGMRDEPENPYWLFPFQNYGTFCPYLVGSYETVAAEIARYLSLGYMNFIVDIPRDGRELADIQSAFEMAKAGVLQ